MSPSLMDKYGRTVFTQAGHNFSLLAVRITRKVKLGRKAPGTASALQGSTVLATNCGSQSQFGVDHGFSYRSSQARRRALGHGITLTPGDSRIQWLNVSGQSWTSGCPCSPERIEMRSRRKTFLLLPLAFDRVNSSRPFVSTRHVSCFSFTRKI